jgi:hypothetical protein
MYVNAYTNTLYVAVMIEAVAPTLARDHNLVVIMCPNQGFGGRFIQVGAKLLFFLRESF